MQIHQLDLPSCDLCSDIVLLYGYIFTWAWNSGLRVSFKACWLSTNTFVAGVWSGVYTLGSSVLVLSEIVCGSAINCDTHMASFTTWVRAIYLALVEDSIIVGCLLLDHDTADHVDSSRVTFLCQWSERIHIHQCFCEYLNNRPSPYCCPESG